MKDTLVEFSFPPEGNRSSCLHVFNICVGIASTRGVGNPNECTKLNNPRDSPIPSETGRCGAKDSRVHECQMGRNGLFLLCTAVKVRGNYTGSLHFYTSVSKSLFPN